MDCKCESCVRENCQDRTKQDDLRIVIGCEDYLKSNTNADRIRAMSDEELAEFLCEFNGCYSDKCPGVELCEFGGGLANGLKKWLQQPAKEGTP